MISLKQGVAIHGISPEVLLGIIICHPVFAKYKVPLTITSNRDGKHKVGSLHYTGYAVDLRLPSRASQEEEVDLSVLVECREALGSNYDIILESDHLHLEYDPKDPLGGA